MVVENQVREFDSKLLVACCAAERGFPVIIGSQFFIYLVMHHLPLGVFFAKSMRSVNGMTFTLIKHLGHHIITCDEEALVRFNSPEYYDWRYSNRTFSAISRFFAWGKDDAEMYKSYKAYSGAPVHITGNPRVDLLRPELRDIFQAKADALRARYGNFVLINTNFSFVNNFVKGLNLIQRDENGKFLRISRAGSGLSRKFAEGQAAHQQAIFDAFRILLPRLCEWFPDTTFVLRPHPSENHQVWREIMAGFDNIHIEHDGNVVPWLMACRCLLHNGCTTAVEATILETPAICYQPVISEIYDYHLPNSLSHRVFNHEQLRTCLADVINGRIGLIDQQARERVYAKHLASMSGSLAADKMVDILVEAGYVNDQPRSRNLPRYIFGWLAMQGRSYIQRLIMLQPNHRTHMRHQNHQFPHISEEEVNSRIRYFGKRLQRFSNIHAEMISPYIFRIKGSEHAD